MECYLDEDFDLSLKDFYFVCAVIWVILCFKSKSCKDVTEPCINNHTHMLKTCHNIQRGLRREASHSFRFFETLKLNIRLDLEMLKRV